MCTHVLTNVRGVQDAATALHRCMYSDTLEDLVTRVYTLPDDGQLNTRSSTGTQFYREPNDYDFVIRNFTARPRAQEGQGRRASAAGLNAS